MSRVSRLLSQLYDARAETPKQAVALDEFIQLLSDDIPLEAKENLEQEIT